MRCIEKSKLKVAKTGLTSVLEKAAMADFRASTLGLDPRSSSPKVRTL